MSDYKYGMTSLIQKTWREFHERNEMKKNKDFNLYYKDSSKVFYITVSDITPMK